MKNLLKGMSFGLALCCTASDSIWFPLPNIMSLLFLLIFCITNRAEEG